MMKTYLIGSNLDVLVWLILLNVVLTAGMFYLFYKILRSKTDAKGDYRLP